MGEEFKIEGEFKELDKGLDEREKRIDDIEAKNVKATLSVVKQTKKSFDEVVGMMRASYMMVSGITQVIGGDMGQMLSAVYGAAVAGITTYQSIAAAIAASGVGTFQAIIMTSSLIAAMVSLSGVMTGQTELSRRVAGINMGLQGIGQSISSWGL